MSEKEESKCPFCNKMVVDILKHFLFEHEIEGIEQFNEEIIKLEKKQNLRREFSKFVEQLKENVQKNIISIEEYRRLITEWTNKHK